MKVTRILVLQEGAGEPRELRLTVSCEPVQFDFRAPEDAFGPAVDLSSYRAVAAPVDCASPDFVESLRQARTEIPPILLFRGEAPLREVARWVVWGDPEPDGDATMAGRLLSESLEYYRIASLYQQCLKLLTSQDDEKRLVLITDTFVNELGAENCVIWLASPTDPDELMIASVRGAISIDREGSRFYLSQTDWAESIWKGLPFLASWPLAAADRSAAKAPTSLYVPLIHQGKPIGLVKLGERIDRKPYADREIFLAKVVADYAASSLKTADRLVRMEKISLRDPDTRAYSEAFLNDYFQKERYKSGRFRRPLSVIFLLIDNFTFLMEQTRESLVVGALSGVVEAIRKALRDSDLIARVEPNRFCIVLPETDYFGSLLTVRRLRKAIRDRLAVQYLGNEFALQPFFMSATVPRDGRELSELWPVAEEKYIRQQKSPYHRLHLQEKPFWDAFDILVGKPEHYDQMKRGEEVPYFSRIRRDLGRNGHFLLSRETFLRLVESVAQDVVTSRDERELVIAAGPRPEMFKQIFLSFGNDGQAGHNIYIVGQSGSTRFDAKNLLYVTAEDEHLRNREVVLFLKENGAYGLFAAGRQDEVCGFNSSDEWLVESMVEKVQDLYSLQGTF